MFRFATATAVFAVAALGQTVIIPGVAEGNSSLTAPFDTANSRLVCVYDASHFTGQGINFPIIITRMKVRANGGTTWIGGTSQLQLDLSTAAVDYLNVNSTFDNNHGTDRVTVFSGPQTSTSNAVATTPAPFLQDIFFQVPFVYYPLAGDLAVDYLSTGIVIANMPTQDLVTTAGVAKAKRVSTTVVANTTGTVTSTESAHVLEFDYLPAIGMYPAFTASTTSGLSPLNVTFTDLSYTTTPGGITSWAWDFNGDAIVDSNLQNPSFAFGCGTFNVSLTVTDAQGSTTLTKTGLISTDDIVASFTSALSVPPNIFQLTDTSTPPATSWAWDTDGDTVADTFVQNPVVALPQCDAVNFSLTATRNCKSDSAAKMLFVAPASLPTQFNGTNGLSEAIVFSDFHVTHPCGISICGISHHISSAVGTPFTFDVYLTESTWVGKDNNIALWRLAGTGSATAQGTGVPSTGPLTTPLHLPPGFYGIGIFIDEASVRYTGSGTTGPPSVFGNADLTITTGASRSTLFAGGSFFQPRAWNGTVHYSTCTLDAQARYGWFGEGCAGTLPAGGQTINSPPVMGSNLSLTFDNLPFSVTVAMLGFSNTFAAGFGPLPIDLTGLGMTGCTARISPDLTFFIVGAANSATLNVFIPADPAFLCVPIYTQALTPDPAGNTFGWVLSAAAGGPIGG